MHNENNGFPNLLHLNIREGEVKSKSTCFMLKVCDVHTFVVSDLKIQRLLLQFLLFAEKFSLLRKSTTSYLHTDVSDK